MKPHSLPLHSATPVGMLIFLQTQFLQPSLEHAFAVAEWKEKRDQEQLDGPLGGNLRIWAIFIVMIKTLDFGQRSNYRATDFSLVLGRKEGRYVLQRMRCSCLK